MIFSFIFFCFLFSQDELVDGVLAVVGDKHILFSEVLAETRMVAERRGISPQVSPMLFQEVFDSVLKEKIYLKVVLISAEKDSLVVVSYDEIKNSLDERIDLFSKQLGSTEALEGAFGLSLGDIKNQYWETIRDELMIEKFRFSLLGDVSISKTEVFDFFAVYKDSIPGFSEKASFAVVEKKIVSSPKTINKIRKKLFSIKDSILAKTKSFEYYAKEHSDDPSVEFNGGTITAERGGDLPYEYERAVFSAKKGEVVGPIKTKLGYHIIKLLDRVGEKTTSQHILLQAGVSKEDSLYSFSFLDSLHSFVNNDPGLFDSLCVSLKADKKNLSGTYENVDLSFFPQHIKDVVITTPSFSFSSVFLGEDSSFLLYKYNYSKPAERDLKNSWSFIESLALNKKRVDLFDVWIQDQLSNIYVKINKTY